MLTAREVALRVNGVRTADARVRRVQKELELVITDPRLGGFTADDSFTLELLEFLHPPEIRRRLPNEGWRKVSLRILIALLQGGVVRVVAESRSDNGWRRLAWSDPWSGPESRYSGPL